MMMHLESLRMMMHLQKIRVNHAFGENEGDDARGGDAEDVARDQEQGHANA